MDNYDLVPSGLIKLVKKSFNAGLDQAGSDIGQPTAFFVGCALNLTPQDREAEIKNLRRKLQGVDFALTQPVFQPELAAAFLHEYAERYGRLEIPVLVGILPLVSAKHANFLNHEVPGSSIPEEAIARMEAAGENAAQVGVELAVELIQKVKPWAQGIYIMPQFHRYDLVAEVVVL